MQQTEQTKYYVRDASGRYFQEIPTGDNYDYIPAEDGLKFEEITQRDHTGKMAGTGRFMEVRDLEERRRQQASDSHKAYFEKLSEDPDPKKARQAMKRLDKLEQQFQTLAIDRASPVGVPSVERITDEQFMNYMSQYQKDLTKGVTKDPTYADDMFVPLQAYQHKLVTRTGRSIRPLYQGEVGMIGSKIITLEAGYGEGQTIAVPQSFGGPKEDV